VTGQRRSGFELGRRAALWRIQRESVSGGSHPSILPHWKASKPRSMQVWRPWGGRERSNTSWSSLKTLDGDTFLDLFGCSIRTPRLLAVVAACHRGIRIEQGPLDKSHERLGKVIVDDCAAPCLTSKCMTSERLKPECRKSRHSPKSPPTQSLSKTPCPKVAAASDPSTAAIPCPGGGRAPSPAVVYNGEFR
jgi:hypothetical protein